MTRRPLTIEVGAVTAGEPGDITRAEQAKALQADALPKIRATAERWAASLTGLMAAVSLAALLRGPGLFDELAPTAQTWGKAFFFAAAIIGLFATGLAVHAAQQTSRRVFLPTAEAIQEAVDDVVEKAVAALWLSRLLATIAVVAAVAAAAWLWWGPVDPSAAQPAGGPAISA